ncbi:Phage integrase SAM-like domain-containing protein [Chitinophaga costaii]|uniref:Phage integrase SAM-like domain-containing protein n=1 Tax=Chitinophaga costaii TaxID=1335309 RepID=A0A1C4EV14_9BACT|nr:site-specific integrase [Chitinophaga costaii]PUZ21627.1 hypothetical protein DCM91_16470 [Chitinophaga costaii]SCC47487.1 Phage integrase SAM-like domain-containing protein [Chitinophaga costaii]
MNIGSYVNPRGDKRIYFYSLGKGKGQRKALGMFTYIKPQNQAEKNHNKEILKLLAVKKSEAIMEFQSIGTGYIPTHKFRSNFYEYYADYIVVNKKRGNRHFANSLTQLKLFTKNPDFLSPNTITEEFCRRFSGYLRGKFNGETPANYFQRFKRVLKAAKKVGYFRESPAEDIAARSSPTLKHKDFLESYEYIQLLKTPCLNQEVSEGYIFSLYTGLRYCDVKKMDWSEVNTTTLQTRMKQAKTGFPVVLTLHPIALTILNIRRQRFEQSGRSTLSGKVFHLPTANGGNKILEEWVKSAKIEKHITWSCARLSFSILLQDEKVDNATVSLLLGHTTSYYVDRTYKRYRPKNQEATISLLPKPSSMPPFLRTQPSIAIDSPDLKGQAQSSSLALLFDLPDAQELNKLLQFSF